MKKHGHIIFNGNNYADSWAVEAKKRGLPNVPNTVDALKAFVTPKSLKVFAKYNVLSEDEMHSRYDIYLEQYAMNINIEAQTGMQMVRRQYMPAAIRYLTELGQSIQATGGAAKVQKDLVTRISKLLESTDKNLKKLEKETGAAQNIFNVEKQAVACRDKVLAALAALRVDIDALEELVPADLWPVPTYSDLLFKL